MKLILASDLSFLLKYGYKLTGILKDKMKIGYITTASKVAREKTFFEDVKNKIIENGYSIYEFDIEGKSKKEIKSFFQDKNIIHLEGGNTFYLLKIIRETGFADILSELLKEGKVYIGTSAGAYVMCPTIEVANWNSDGKDRFNVNDFTALNYVPFVLKVHYTDEKKQTMKNNLINLKYPLHILKDGQGILVEDDQYTFLGDEEETILNI